MNTDIRDRWIGLSMDEEPGWINELILYVEILTGWIYPLIFLTSRSMYGCIHPISNLYPSKYPLGPGERLVSARVPRQLR